MSLITSTTKMLKMHNEILKKCTTKQSKNAQNVKSYFQNMCLLTKKRT